MGSVNFLMQRAFGQIPAVFLLCLLQLSPPAAAQYDDGEGWLEVASQHFTVYTNAGQDRGVEITASLERFRAVFAQLSPEIDLRSPAPTKILAFRNGESYAPYKTSPDRLSSRILGQFLSHPDGNYLTLDAGTRLVGAFTVIYHEYVHYFVRHNFAGIPRWFNEGLAEYYSTFTTDGESAHVGQAVERHVRWLQQHSELDLASVLTADEGTKGGHSEQQTGRFYAVSWALVHYLLSGDSERLDRAADFFLRLRSGESAEVAFEEAFELRLSSLQKDLQAYIASGELPSASIPLSRLPTARVKVREMVPEDMLFHLGDLLAHSGREQAAEQHFQLALDHWGDHPETHAGLAFVRDLQNRFEEAELFYRDAVSLGSKDPLTYLLYGRHLMIRASATVMEERAQLADQAIQQLKRVVEIDATFGEGWALLGRAYLVGSEEILAGLEAIRRARLLLPERVDVVESEVRLLLRLKRFDAAEILVEDVLAFLASFDVVAEARETVLRHRMIQASVDAFERNEIEAGLSYFDRAISATSDLAQREKMEAQLLAMQERFLAEH